MYNSYTKQFGRKDVKILRTGSVLFFSVVTAFFELRTFTDLCRIRFQKFWGFYIMHCHLLFIIIHLYNSIEIATFKKIIYVNNETCCKNMKIVHLSAAHKLFLQAPLLKLLTLKKSILKGPYCTLSCQFCLFFYLLKYICQKSLS